MLQAIEQFRQHPWLVSTALFLFSALIYTQTLFFDFIWDDVAVIVYNQNITSPAKALQTFYRPAKQPYNAAEYRCITDLTAKNWRPLRTLVHSLIYRIGKKEPLYYHLANILLHGSVVLLFFWLLVALLNDFFAALVGALLFAVHPVNSEVVCWAKSLEDLLATAFLLLTFKLLITLPGRKAKWGHAATLLLCYALALSSKLSTVFFPLFLLLWLGYRCYLQNGLSNIIRTYWSNESRRLIVIVLLGLEALAAVITRSIVIGGTAQGDYLTGNCWTTWLSMPRVLLRYLAIEIIPCPLYGDYMNYPRAISITDPVAWSFTGLFLLTFVVVSWLLSRQRLLSPWLWFWTALLPFLNIVAMNQLGAERFLYIPTLGFCWLAAELFKRGWKRWEVSSNGSISTAQKHLLAGTAAVMVVFLFLTVNRSQVWSNRLIFWKTATQQFPHSQRPRRNLIKAYIHFKRPYAALPYAKGLLKDYPLPQNVNLLAHVSYMINGPDRVISALYRHKKPQALNYIAILAAKQKRFAAAERAALLGYKLKADRESYDTLNRVAIYAARQGDMAVAERCLRLAATIDKNDKSVNIVGVAAAKRGNIATARRCFKFALQLSPGNKKYLTNLALLRKQEEAMRRIGRSNSGAPAAPQPARKSNNHSGKH